jgi:hypothetical protein
MVILWANAWYAILDVCLYYMALLVACSTRLADSLDLVSYINLKRLPAKVGNFKTDKHLKQI